jgi:hypothetical protein
MLHAWFGVEAQTEAEWGSLIISLSSIFRSCSSLPLADIPTFSPAAVYDMQMLRGKDAFGSLELLCQIVPVCAMASEWPSEPTQAARPLLWVMVSLSAGSPAA